jgi:hypothetical protein
MKLSPAKYVIRIFGGVRSAAFIIGRHPGSVSRWQTPKTSGGYGGTIPKAARLTILKIAKRRKLPITSRDLDYGRTI